VRSGRIPPPQDAFRSEGIPTARLPRCLHFEEGSTAVFVLEWPGSIRPAFASNEIDCVVQAGIP